MEKTFTVSGIYEKASSEWETLVTHTITSLDLKGDEEALMITCYKHYLSDYQHEGGTKVIVLIAQKDDQPLPKDEIILYLADPNQIIEILRYWTNCYVGTTYTENQCCWVNRIES